MVKDEMHRLHEDDTYLNLLGAIQSQLVLSESQSFTLGRI